MLVFTLFFLSGFCALLYQIIWIRLSFAHFGIIIPVLSVVVSVFMLGLGAGSYGAGRLAEFWRRRSPRRLLVCYALSETLVGIGGLVVPSLFSAADSHLLAAGEINSFHYLALSALAIALSILPWCLCMGATLPFMLGFLKARQEKTDPSFSFLYLANVFGALTGVLLTAGVLIEVWGFRHTLVLAAGCNFGIALASLSLLRPRARAEAVAKQTPFASLPQLPKAVGKRLVLESLFLTGLLSMSLEVIWTRAFTPVLKTTIYAFALILATYLLATWLGSLTYRARLRKGRVKSLGELAGWMAAAAFWPILLTDPRLNLRGIGIVTGIFPLCFLLGYWTPLLIDQWTGGFPAPAGLAYAINVVGCVLGPLVASYLLLPAMSPRVAMVLCGAAFLYLFARYAPLLPRTLQRRWAACLIVLAGFSLWPAQDYESLMAATPGAQLRRDATASVLSFGQGMEKRLMVNGIWITNLSPLTKIMAHLPLAALPRRPRTALVICFGMGTTFRSIHSWGIDVTAVELVPSVPRAFGYYFDDAAAVLRDSHSRVVIDDGRRFLHRTPERFDVITLDPPPPVEAAGSSLLYSEEFYALCKNHLTPSGILQQWFPYGEKPILQAVARSIHDSFCYVRVYKGVGGWGYHLLASDQPIDALTASEFLKRLPASARRDLAEWPVFPSLAVYAQHIVSQEVDIRRILAPDPTIRITDDHPYNEYYLVRRAVAKWNHSYVWVH